MRLDVYLAENKYSSSRSRAKALIESKAVKVNDKIVSKPSFEIDVAKEYDISVDDSVLPYESRGGLKLKAAIDAFELVISAKRCVDIGASTGGFTDCMLRHGAKIIYAVDSGSDQLSERLRRDPAVVCIERFNARNMTVDTVGGEVCQFAAADLSFISQTYVLDAASSLLCEGASYVGLIKPQFECGREAVGKGGVVKGAVNYRYAVDKVFNGAAKAGFDVVGLIASPIKGGDGNTEFLMLARKRGDGMIGNILVSNDKIDNVIAPRNISGGRVEKGI